MFCRNWQLGNAFWTTHLVEADEAAAARFLDKAAAAYQRGAKLDAAAARPLLERLPRAAEQRAAAVAVHYDHRHERRLEICAGSATRRSKLA